MTLSRDAIEAMDALAAFEEADHAQQQAVLLMVAKKVTPDVFHDIERCISESERTHSYSIVHETAGSAQEDGFAFGTYFVDHWAISRVASRLRCWIG